MKCHAGIEFPSGSDCPKCKAKLGEVCWPGINADLARLPKLREALRAFVTHATYPVSTEINPRGYAWRGEEALDYAKALADAALKGTV